MGVMRLFEHEETRGQGEKEKLYVHLPPTRPFWIPDDAD